MNGDNDATLRKCQHFKAPCYFSQRIMSADEHSVTAGQFPLLFLELSVQHFPCQSSKFHLLFVISCTIYREGGPKYRPGPPQSKTTLRAGPPVLPPEILALRWDHLICYDFMFFPLNPVKASPHRLRPLVPQVLATYKLEQYIAPALDTSLLINRSSLVDYIYCRLLHRRYDVMLQLHSARAVALQYSQWFVPSALWLLSGCYQHSLQRQLLK